MTRCLSTIAEEFHEVLSRASQDPKLDALTDMKSVYLGPKGKMTLLLRSLGALSAETRPQLGKEVNRVRHELEMLWEARLAEREQTLREKNLKAHRLDLTLPGRALHFSGAHHPISRVMQEMIDIFSKLGFQTATGPEVELDFFNFQALNFPPDHPARDMQDTFFVEPNPLAGPRSKATDDREKLLLRTHTSPVQIRALQSVGAPLHMIAPGRVYRCDQDATHSPMFHQLEALSVDENVSFAHLKGVLTAFLNSFFGARPVRFRPSYFPFVEPGAEVDVRCVLCEGNGCRVCKSTGWLEIGGAGMVHPHVLEVCGVDPERYTGFAFGMGIDRIAMLRYGIDDLSHLFRSDMRFLSQL